MRNHESQIAFTAALVSTALSLTLSRECKADDVCPENPGGTGICFAWAETPDPEEGTDFTVDYDCEGCDTAPDVKLLTGSDTWRIWSVANGGAEGNISRLWAENAEDYTVRIVKLDGATQLPGAANVGLIDLDPSDAANYSRLAGGTITGNLTGDLFVQKSSGGTGGSADGFTIEGDVDGELTIALADGKGFTIEGDVLGDNTLTKAIINLADISGGTFQIGGELNQFVVINITQMGSTATFKCGYLSSNGVAMQGDVIFASDLPTGATVDMSKANIGVLGSLSFGTHDIDGAITIYNLGSGVIARDLAGTVDVKTEFESSGLLDLSGSMSGTFRVNTNEGSSNNNFFGEVHMDGDMTGSALIKHFPGADGIFSTGAVIEVSGTSGIGNSASIVLEGNVLGDITVDDDLEGDILTEGTQSNASVITLGGIASTGVLFFGGNVDGDTHVTGNVAGDIVLGTATLPANLGTAGTIDIDGTLTGDVQVTGDVDVNSTETSVTVDTLGAGGRILVDGLCKDFIVIEKGTASTSLIQLIDGLYSGAEIVINSSQGEYNAVGDIFIGDPSTFCGTCSLVTVVYDGVIRVREFSSGGDGDLDGDLTVVGCHTSEAELELCVDGDINGTVTIYQSGCQEQVPGYTCTP